MPVFRTGWLCLFKFLKSFTLNNNDKVCLFLFTSEVASFECLVYKYMKNNYFMKGRKHCIYMYSTGIKPNTSTVGRGDERGRGRGRGRGARGRGRAAAGTSRTIMDCKFNNITGNTL